MEKKRRRKNIYTNKEIPEKTQKTSSQMGEANQIMAVLREVEEMQAWKIAILKTVNASDESLDVIGEYVNVLIREFRKGNPTEENIEVLRQLNRGHGGMKIALVKLQVALEDTYDNVDGWMQAENTERTRRKQKIRKLLEKALEIAERVKMHEEGEKLEAVVKLWKETE